jgi:hypothetical protein
VHLGLDKKRLVVNAATPLAWLNLLVLSNSRPKHNKQEPVVAQQQELHATKKLLQGLLLALPILLQDSC